MHKTSHDQFTWSSFKGPTVLLIFLLSLDLTYSFYQHIHMPIGGDIAQIIVPPEADGYRDVLNDPFGFEMIRTGKPHHNPNRIFAHWFSIAYLLNMPLLIQQWVSPIESIYISHGLLKITIQFGILLILACLALRPKDRSLGQLMLLMVLMAPLFQTNGFYDWMAIIDKSIIYTIFYALPLLLLLLYFLALKEINLSPTPWSHHFFIFPFLLIAPMPLLLGGPIIPGVVMVLLVMLFSTVMVYTTQQKNKNSIIDFWKSPKIKFYAFLFCWNALLCMYSLYLGTYNLSNVESVSLAQRYILLPEGVVKLLFTKPGFSIVIATLILNFTIISRSHWLTQKSNLLKQGKWFLIFSIVYLLLLPLGGYREYRPQIIRYDTFMPVTIGMIYLFGLTTYHLIVNLNWRKYYISTIAGVLLIFIWADKIDNTNQLCEVEALKIISESKEEIVELDNQCPIIEYRIVHDPGHSNLKANLLYHWNVTDKVTMFYQRE